MAATPILRRSLIPFFSDGKFLFLRESHISFSLYFSTKAAKQPLDGPTVSQFFIDNHFSPKAAAKKIMRQTRLSSRENADSVLSFLKSTGFSKSQLEKIFTTSLHLLSADLEADVKQKFETLRDLGFTQDEIIDLIARRPKVLRRSAPQIASSVSELKRLFGSTAAALKILRSCGSVFGKKPMEGSFIPNVETLKSFGVPTEQILATMTSAAIFAHRPDNLRKFVEKAVEMGSDTCSTNFIRGVQAIASMSSEKFELKVKTLRELGFSEGDLRRAFRKSPDVFTASPERMKATAEVLLATGKFSMSSIIEMPIVLRYSTEGRVVPRIEIIRALEQRNLIRKWPSLATMLCVSHSIFFDRFVSPHFDQVGELWKMKGKSADDEDDECS